MKKRDGIILGAFLGAVAVLLLLSQMLLGQSATQAVVLVDGAKVLRVPLDRPGEYRIPGLGEGESNTIAVEDGAVFMKEANCRDGLCMTQGKTATPGKTIVCLPHRVVVQPENRAESPQKDDLDTMVF